MVLMNKCLRVTKFGIVLLPVWSLLLAIWLFTTCTRVLRIWTNHCALVACFQRASSAVYLATVGDRRVGWATQSVLLTAVSDMQLLTTTCTPRQNTDWLRPVWGLFPGFQWIPGWKALKTGEKNVQTPHLLRGAPCCFPAAHSKSRNDNSWPPQLQDNHLFSNLCPIYYHHTSHDLVHQTQQTIAQLLLLACQVLFYFILFYCNQTFGGVNHKQRGQPV